MEARVTVHADHEIARIDPRLYSSFLKYLGWAIHGGILEPGHPTADGRGFRGDMAGLLRELSASSVHRPGGNSVSA